MFQVVQLREGCPRIGCCRCVLPETGSTWRDYPESMLHRNWGWGCYYVEFLSWPRKDCQAPQHSHSSGQMADWRLQETNNHLSLSWEGKSKMWSAWLYCVVIFLDFHSTKQGVRDCHWLILDHMALTKIKCIPIVIHYSTRSKHGGKRRDRRREKHCQFSLSGVNTPRVLNTNMKPQAKKATIFKVIPEEKQQLVSSGGKWCRWYKEITL